MTWTCDTRKSKLLFPLLLPEFHSRMQESPRDRGKKVRHFVCRNDSFCAKVDRHGPEQTEHGEGIFRGPRHRRCRFYSRTNRCAMADDCEYVCGKGLKDCGNG